MSIVLQDMSGVKSPINAGVFCFKSDDHLQSQKTTACIFLHRNFPVFFQIGGTNQCGAVQLFCMKSEANMSYGEKYNGS